jgi:hypothetical protein
VDEDPTREVAGETPVTANAEPDREIPVEYQDGAP